MSYIPGNLRQLIIQEAGSRCEYCRLSQTGQEATFHIDHVLPLTLGGETLFENLALACVSCSLRKAARITANDPQTGIEATLFNPRRENWHEHFKWEGDYLTGLTATGRATVEALKMNRTMALAIRHEQAVQGRHPPT